MIRSSEKRATWDYKPLSVYRPFHASPAKERLLVGGMGSGKTIALMGDAIATGLQVPGLHIGMIRKTVPELRDTTEVEFLNVLPHDLYMASKVRKSGGHIESITFPNGTRYAFRSVDDWQKFKSINFGRLYIDELNELDPMSYNGLVSRVRQTMPLKEAQSQGYTEPLPDWVRQVSGAANSAGKDWMYKRFIKDSDATRAHWVATTLDNPHLPLDYLEALFSMPRPWVMRYVLCSFDAFGGLIYPQWDYDKHVLKETLQLHRATPIWQGFDPGTRHPTAVLYVAVVDRRLIGVHEELAPDTAVDVWAAKMRAAERRLPPVTWRVADPNSIHVRDRGTQVSLHAQYRREGFLFQDGPSRHEDRIPMLGNLLDTHRFALTRACPKTAEQIENYRWEDLTAAMKQKLGEHAEEYGPEKPVKVNDDLVDTAQYLSSRWVRPIKATGPDKLKPQTDWQRQSEEIRATLAQQRKGRNQGRREPGVLV